MVSSTMTRRRPLPWCRAARSRPATRRRSRSTADTAWSKWNRTFERSAAASNRTSFSPLRETALIDHEGVAALKVPVLEELFALFLKAAPAEAKDIFEHYCYEQGKPVGLF